MLQPGLAGTWLRHAARLSDLTRVTLIPAPLAALLHVWSLTAFVIRVERIDLLRLSL